jgi:pimeloyl-ACP methyl ester carboxylesterase
MGPENHAEFGAALAGEEPLRAWLTENATPMRTVTGSDIIAGFGGLISQVDKDVLHGGFADEMAAEMRRALERGFDGWIDDDIAFVRPWGFDVEAMTVPVTVWQGDRDLMVPEAHGTWLAEHIPSATARPASNHGHISLVTTFQREIVADLLAARVA